MEYLGHLPEHDPMYDYLCRKIMPKIGAEGKNGFRVFSSRSSHTVYIYEDRATGKRVVGKFFAADEPDFEHAKRKMYREFNNINEFRKYLGKDHYIARALGCNESLGCLLAVEYCYGVSPDTFILRAVYQKEESILYRKLSALANFLAVIHNRSALPVMVDFRKICSYYNNVIHQVSPILHPGEADYFYELRDKYLNDPQMYQDQAVLVHGDATPANFFFGDDMYVISFDLERMQRSDRLFDTGRIAGELKHFFLAHTGNKYAAEPFIEHFLREYCSYFPDRDRAFAAITARLPFYMGKTLLRIARNDYLPYDYRRSLVKEAKLTLKR